MLRIVLHVERVDHAEECHNREDIGKDEAYLVHATKREAEAKEADLAIGAGRHAQTDDHGHGR